MDNKEYGDLVNQGKYPDNVEIPLDAPFIDARGIIQNLWLSHSGSITLIKSNKGAKRAAHRHTEDWHACYIVGGKLKYTEGETTDVKKLIRIYSDNDMFFTRPGVFHTMEFLEDTVMITVNNIVKNHNNYEKDVVRL